MRGGIRSFVGLTPVLLVVAGLVGPAGAEGSGHDAVNFIKALDRIREGASGGTYEADVERGTHGRGPATADVTTYRGEKGSPATAGSDYEPTTDTLNFAEAIDSDYATIPIIDDGVLEGPETFTLKLENLTTGMVKAFPQEMTVSILDNEGPARTSFELAGYEIFENAGRARAYVVRSGSISAAETIQYETHNSSALAGKDYAATSGTLQFPASDDFEWIDVPLINDTTAEGSETFSIELTSSAVGAISEPSSTTITIHDEDRSQTVDDTAPYTAFHHPLHKEKYEARDMRTLVAFMQDDENGTGMKRVDLAIRMKRDDGTCRWWNGTSFRERSCSRKRWADTGRGTETRVSYFTDTAIFELGKSLKSSNRASDIRYYTAYCRGHDIADNVQREFVKGQNRNNFDIKR